MRLYLVQHGHAHPKEIDPEQGLTDKGSADVGRVASFMKSLGIRVGVLWESGKTRATQTARIIASHLELDPTVVQCTSGLSPLDPVAPVAREIESLGMDLMIVGHLPFLARLASYLVMRKEEPALVKFRYGGVVCLERTGEAEPWMVSWMIVPECIPPDVPPPRL